MLVDAYEHEFMQLIGVCEGHPLGPELSASFEFAIKSHHMFSRASETYPMREQMIAELKRTNLQDPTFIAWYRDFILHAWLINHLETIPPINCDALKQLDWGQPIPFYVVGGNDVLTLLVDPVRHLGGTAQWPYRTHGEIVKMEHSSAWEHLRGVGSVRGSLGVTCEQQWYEMVAHMISSSGITKKRIEFYSSASARPSKPAARPSKPAARPSKPAEREKDPMRKAHNDIRRQRMLEEKRRRAVTFYLPD